MKITDIELVDFKMDVKHLHTSISYGTTLMRRYIGMVLNANIIMEEHPNINQVRFSFNGKMSVSFHR